MPQNGPVLLKPSGVKNIHGKWPKKGGDQITGGYKVVHQKPCYITHVKDKGKLCVRTFRQKYIQNLSEGSGPSVMYLQQI